MPGTVFPKPLDKEVASLNSHIANDDAVLLATFTEAMQEKALAESIEHFKYLLLIAYFVNGDNTYVCASTLVPVSLSYQYIIACLNDGTVRKVQVYRQNNTTFKTASASTWSNITYAYLYGVNRVWS